MSEMLTCRELIEFLDDYTQGRQEPSVRADFERHLAVCRACRDYLKTYRDTIALTRISAADSPLPPGAPEDLIRAITESRRRS